VALIPLAEIPARGVARHGADAWAIRHEHDVVTWGELAEHSLRRAHALREAGVGAGDLVTLALPNGSAFYELMFALWTIGATPHVVSYRLPLAELQAIVEVAEPRLVIAAERNLQVAFGAKSADFGRDHADTTPIPPVIVPRWKAMSSGGSTGRPKIIVAPGPNAIDPDRKPPLRFPADGPILATGPVYHNMPVTTNIQALFEGHSIVGMSRFEPEEALRLIDAYSIRWTSFVPTMMMRIARLPDDVRASYDLSSLETVWHWAAPMPPDLKQQWIDWLGPEKIWELYGGTEGIVTTILNGVEWLDHRGSVGRPHLDKIKIVDEDGRDLPVGEVGEIFAMPAGGQGSTYNYIGAESRSTTDGYETLGDFGWLDEEGYLYIADRRTDMIVSGGANIFPAEVEGALSAHPDVEGAVVIGLPDDDFGAIVHAIVQPTTRARDTLDAETLIAFLRDRLVNYKLPRTFEFVDGPLRDDAGKVRRQQLRAMRLTGQQAEDLRVPSKTEA